MHKSKLTGVQKKRGKGVIFSGKKDTRSSDGKPVVEDVDYEYHVEVVASEAFKNMMSKFGVGFGYETGSHSFTSKELIGMEKIKSAGIIRAYKILKCAKLKSVVKEE